MKKTNPELLYPFLLTFGIIILDQLTKLWIVQNIPLNTIGYSFLDSFLRIIHVRNTGVAFSLGAGWSAPVRMILFTFVPAGVLIGLIAYYFQTPEFTKVQRWAIAGIIGGGFGNIIDRMFRADGVVDFIDVRFFGLFGMERFPTFNVADSSVVICGILLMITLFMTPVEFKTSEPQTTEPQKKESDQP
jgi:signal peptidase II